MGKHKVAKKVASSTISDRIIMAEWLEESHPEVFKQWEAIKDLEQAVEEDTELQLHRRYLEMQAELLEQEKIKASKFAEIATAYNEWKAK